MGTQFYPAKAFSLPTPVPLSLFALVFGFTSSDFFQHDGKDFTHPAFRLTYGNARVVV